MLEKQGLIFGPKPPLGIKVEKRGDRRFMRYKKHPAQLVACSLLVLTSCQVKVWPTWTGLVWSGLLLWLPLGFDLMSENNDNSGGLTNRRGNCLRPRIIKGTGELGIIPPKILVIFILLNIYNFSSILFC